jgi:hypothetical protein
VCFGRAIDRKSDLEGLAVAKVWAGEIKNSKENNAQYYVV